MAIADTARGPLRLWPGVAAAVLLLLGKFVMPVIVPEAAGFGMFGAILSALAIFVWWVFFSRAPWSERLGAIVLMIVAAAATSRVLHVSIAGAMMGLMFPLYAMQTLSVALVAGAAVSRRFTRGRRRAAMVVAILLGCGVWAFVRTDGVIGSG